MCAAFESYSTLEASSHQPILGSLSDLDEACSWFPNAPRGTARLRIKSIHIHESQKHLVRVTRGLFTVLVRLHLAACRFVSAPTATKLRVLPSKGNLTHQSSIAAGQPTPVAAHAGQLCSIIVCWCTVLYERWGSPTAPLRHIAAPCRSSTTTPSRSN